MPESLPLYGEADRIARIMTVAPLDNDKSCTRCPLSAKAKTVCMEPRGEPGGLLIVGESPGRTEDYAGEPFVGKSGQLLRRVLTGNWAGPVAVTNAIGCYPGRDADEAKVDACLPYLTGTIDRVKPTRIVALGALASYALTGRSIAPYSSRRAYGWLAGSVVPMFFVIHPAAGLRNRFVEQWFEDDMAWALTAEAPAPAHLLGVMRVVDGGNAAQARAELLGAGWFAFDCETSGRAWDRDFKVLCVAAVARGSRDAWVWDAAALGDAATAAVLRELLSSARIKKTGSNVKYDMLAMEAAFGYEVRGVDGDVRLERKLLDPEADGSLDAMAELVGMGGHKAEAVAAKRNTMMAYRRACKDPSRDTPTEFGLSAAADAALRLGAEPDQYVYGMISKAVLHKYCARDGVGTAALGELLEARLAGEPALERTWRLLVRPAIPAVARMEAWGIPVDLRAVDAFRSYLAAGIGEIAERFKAYPEMNPASPRSVADQLYDKLGLYSRKQTEGGARSVDRETLEAIDHPLARDLLAWRKLTKLKGTYADAMVGHVRDDGRVHPNYLIDGARSGRMSCVVGSTPVLTNGGVKPIARVRVGDMVWTHRRRWRRVAAFLPQGRQNTYLVRFSNGEILLATSDHKILSSSGEWMTVEEALYERVENVDERTIEPESCLGALPQHGAADDRNDRARVGGYVSQRAGRAVSLHVKGGVEGALDLALLGIEDRRQESHEGEDGRGAPQLERPLRRRLRLSNALVEGQAPVRTQNSNDGGARSRGVAGEVRGAPHRWRSEEQRIRQPGDRYALRPQDDSLSRGEGQPFVSVEEVVPCGSAEVFDLTVEEDHSYATGCVFSHNCSSPNLQNQPRAQTPEGKMARDMFRAPEGRVFVEADFAQIELRIAAMLSGDDEMAAVFKRGEDLHLATAKLIAPKVWGIHPDEVTDAHRSLAKGFVFGLLYGMTDETLAARGGITLREAEAIRSAVLGKFRKLAAWIEERRREAMRTGEVWTSWLGQPARRSPLYRIADEGYEAGSSRSRAEHGSFNRPIQGTASDYCLASLTEVVEWIRGDGIDAKLVAAVHDSLLVECRQDEANEIANKLIEIMTSWPCPGVSLVVDAKVGPSWGSLARVDFAAKTAAGPSI